VDVQRKYGILRAIGWFFQALGVIFFVGAVIVGIGMLANSDPVVKAVGGAVIPLGIISSIQLFVVGALTTLMTDVEYNTRANAEVVAQLAREMKDISAELKGFSGDLSGDVRQLSADMRGYANEIKMLAAPAPPPPPPLEPEPEPEPALDQDSSPEAVDG